MDVDALSFTDTFKCTMCSTCCQNWGVFVSEKIMNDIMTNNNEFSEFKSTDDFCSVVNNLNPVYHALITMDDGKCIFLNNGKCRIFKTFGKNNGNPLCICYPFLKIKLKNKYAIICTLSCKELREKVFRDDIVFIENVNEDKYKNWPAIILNNNDSVCFSQISNTFLTWEAFYFLENNFLNKSYSSYERILFNMAEINKTLMNEKNKILDTNFVNKMLNDCNDKPIIYSSYTENILFFLKRKINLYEKTPFHNLSKEFIDNKNIFPEMKRNEEFIDNLKKWEYIFYKLFILKFYSNPSNFLISIQFFWHVLFFYFSFLKIILYARWIKNKAIEKNDITHAIEVIEMHFVHDSKVFQFWGQGRRGLKDFDENSLFKFLI